MFILDRSTRMGPLWSILLLTAAGLACATEVPPQVHELMLDNGLKVLVREDHRAPVVVSQIWYKVGSGYERSGITGISHVLEHMMFNGTTKVAPGEFSQIVAANGGSQNAFTSRDYTAYFQTLENTRLEVSFRLEADRMENLLLDEDEFAREVRVVQEERRLRTEDSPQGLTYEQFSAAAFVTSPYRYPIIGWMSDLEAMRVEDLQAWYRQWYVPNNATLVVVGAVEPEQVLALARTHFGPLLPRELPILKPTLEIPQLGERRIVVKVPAELPQVLLGYKAPVLKTAVETWEPFALQVLAGILGQGESARLNRNLVRGSEVAASAWVRYGLTSRLDDLFMLGGNPVPERDAGVLEKALRAEVARLQHELVSRQELSRVVAQVIAEDVYQRDSMFYQAMRLGVLETIGLGWRIWEEYVGRIKAVTPEQVRDVARRYLHDDRLTVATLVPLPLEQRQPRPFPAISDDIIK